MTASGEHEVRIPEGTVVLDKYRVERTIGVGGMGIVVQASHPALGTRVAIKFLLPQFAVSHDAARRFIREAQATSKITSEHIVRVFDTGNSRPYGPYIVMEYLEGSDLSRIVRHSGPLAIDVAIDYIVQAGVALGEAHAMGIIHRDVKPANLFLVARADGASLVKVLDFGISKVAEETSLEVTKTTAILGSGLYMSPEQMKSAKNVDHRTDVYGLGVSLFELLTGTQPFTAESFPELCIKVNMDPPADLRRFRPDVPPDLAAVIAKAYARRPEDRYQTMGELAAALSPWAAPFTRANIARLSRMEARHPRPGSSPSIAPSVPPPPTFDGELRIPRPPTLPTPSSVGMDTFGLSGRKGADPLGQTSDKSFVTGRSGRKSPMGTLGIGIAVGVVLSVAAVAFFFLGYGSPGATASSEPTAVRSSAAGPAGESPSASSSPAPAATAEPRIGPTVAPEPPHAQTATPSGKPAPTLRATATQPTATAAATVKPAPTTEPAPCGIRDLDGTLRECPK